MKKVFLYLLGLAFIAFLISLLRHVTEAPCAFDPGVCQTDQRGFPIPVNIYGLGIHLQEFFRTKDLFSLNVPLRGWILIFVNVLFYFFIISVVYFGYSKLIRKSKKK